jgi:hypothetical protein
MPREVGNTGNDVAAPVVDDLFCLIRKNFAGKPKVSLIYLSESSSGLEVFETPAWRCVRTRLKVFRRNSQESLRALAARFFS